MRIAPKRPTSHQRSPGGASTKVTFYRQLPHYNRKLPRKKFTTVIKKEFLPTLAY